ncbi:MAG: GDP-mannose 4,6-dehydratase [Candidatus Shapirobacteria bacterium]|nr:GDP-mannose 4,6-dehydratase [Candidatus Shapirobacteria bacterium]
MAATFSTLESMEIDNKFRGKNVLVTGGTGFVGSHLVEELVSLGAKVVTTFEYTDPRSYFMMNGLDKKVTMANVDVGQFDKVFDLVTKFEIEYIFHLAAQAIVTTAYNNPRRTLESNIMGTTNILESARLYPIIKAVVVASSDKAYGKLEAGKYTYVEVDPLKGDHPYDVSKSATDLIANMYFKTYNVPEVTTRFGNIYGEGDNNFSRIIPGIMRSLIKKETLEIRSDGKMVRDYLYVKDVVRGYLMLAEKIDETKGEAFNFGSNDTLSVLELIKETEIALKRKIPYEILNIAKNEIPYQSLSYEKIKRIGWKQDETIKSTAKKVFDWYLKLEK